VESTPVTSTRTNHSAAARSPSTMRSMYGAKAVTPNVKVEFVSASRATASGRKTVNLKIPTDSLSVSSEGSRK
jgi:hypothetical protein